MSYVGKNAYSAGKTSEILGMVPQELTGPCAGPLWGGGSKIWENLLM